jgi:hypothetical protein
MRAGENADERFTLRFTLVCLCQSVPCERIQIVHVECITLLIFTAVLHSLLIDDSLQHTLWNLYRFSV